VLEADPGGLPGANAMDVIYWNKRVRLDLQISKSRPEPVTFMTNELCPRRRAEIVLALLKGETTFENACRENDLSDHELQSWITDALPSERAHSEALAVLGRVRRRVKMHPFAGAMASIRFDGSELPINDFSAYWCSCVPLPEPARGELILFFSKKLLKIVQIDLIHANLCLGEEFLRESAVELDASYSVKHDCLSICFDKNPGRQTVGRSLLLPEPLQGEVWASIDSSDMIGEAVHLSSITVTRASSCMPKTFLSAMLIAH
jgi:hypothetical protein